MSYNQFESPYRPRELAAERKAASDIKNDTDSLTFGASAKSNVRAKAYRDSRDKKDRMEISKLRQQTDEELMLIELELLENDAINE